MSLVPLSELDSESASEPASEQVSANTCLPFDFSKPLIMGVLNTTPDSFSDGGRFADVKAAVDHALYMADQGADMIDVGGESTRPGARPVSVAEELKRVVPVIREIRAQSDIYLSVDTSTSLIMREARDAGANMINDVRALFRHDALQVASELGLPVCLMHMKGSPENMQDDPDYRDLAGEICAYFEGRIAACESVGINRSQLILDPGFGFGKTVQHNMQLLNQLALFKKFGLPLLIGVSRKSTIGKITGAEVDDRLSGSIAGAVIAAMNGADILRVHDVKETFEALKMVNAVKSEAQFTTSRQA